MISGFADVTFCNLPMWTQRAQAGNKELADSLSALEMAGCIARTDFQNLIRNERFDIVLFEFYDAAMMYLDAVRFHQPWARIIVDSVDLHFRRFLAKAKVEGTDESIAYAARIKREELTIYQSADSVILVTIEDVETLKVENPQVHTGLIPNIHTVPPLVDKQCSDPAQLIFVGGFRHAPNEDAILYFARNIWPQVKVQLPSANIAVVGEQPPEAVRQLNGPDFHVLGHVLDLACLLRGADVSVAPLRWGGGIKGKVGEAMAHGLPVVTTSVGAEGFGLVSGQHAIIADDPDAFAEGIVRLVRDGKLYQSMRQAGHALVQKRFSPDIVRCNVEAYFNEVLERPVKGLGIVRSIRLSTARLWRRHVAWRV